MAWRRVLSAPFVFQGTTWTRLNCAMRKESTECPRGNLEDNQKTSSEKHATKSQRQSLSRPLS